MGKKKWQKRVLLHLAMATKSGQIYVELVGATDKNEPKTLHWFGQ